MFEFHGWVAVNLNNQNKEQTDASFDINDIKSLIEEHQNLQTRVDIFYQMGQPYIRIDGRLNHYQGWVLKLFFAINDLSHNSEGILFIKDESNPCLNSQFRVWQMMNGEVLSGDLTFFPDKYNSHHNSLQIA